MKYVTVREIEANDVPADAVSNPIAPVALVLALAFVAHLFIGCAETEEPDDAPAAAREVAIGEGDAALLASFPDNVWTGGVLKPYADLSNWNIQTGGFNKWPRVRITTAGDAAAYKAPFTYATLGKSLPAGATCVLVGSYSNGYMNCNGLTYKCPKATPVTPTAISNGAAQPSYTFADSFRVSYAPVLTYAQFYRSGDSFRCDYNLAGVEITVARK